MELKPTLGCLFVLILFHTSYGKFLCVFDSWRIKSGQCVAWHKYILKVLNMFSLQMGSSAVSIVSNHPENKPKIYCFWHIPNCLQIVGTMSLT